MQEAAGKLARLAPAAELPQFTSDLRKTEQDRPGEDCANLLLEVSHISVQVQKGKGSLVKAFHERIVEDATNGDLKCPECGIEFARPAVIKGLPANKFIGGKVNMQK